MQQEEGGVPRDDRELAGRCVVAMPLYEGMVGMAALHAAATRGVACCTRRLDEIGHEAVARESVLRLARMWHGGEVEHRGEDVEQ